MGIGYYNNSGCADPTAHTAVSNMEGEEKILRIEYPSGKMVIRMNTFFPSTLERSRKLFRLMAKYSRAEDQKRLYVFLVGLEKKYRIQEDMNSRKAAKCSKKVDIRKYETEARRAKTLRERTSKNIDQLYTICRLGDSV